MNAIMQMIMSQLGGNTVSQIAQKLGISPQVAEKAVSAAVPLLMSAMARNASNPQGATSLFNALTNDHDGSILDDVAGFITNAEAGPGAGILKHVLGQNRPVIQKQLGKTTGIDANTMGKVLEMAAPLVMGALGRTTQQQSLDPIGLSNYLNVQRSQVQQQAPDVFGTIGKLLDQDGDGNPINEVGGLLGKLFGKKKV